MPKCKDCKWWLSVGGHEPYRGNEKGQCCRYPPNDKILGGLKTFLVTVAGEGCGEFEARKPKVYSQSVNVLLLSIRTKNCLNSYNIKTIGDLTQKTKSELLHIRNFGECSFNEIERKLADINLSLNTGNNSSRPSP